MSDKPEDKPVHLEGIPAVDPATSTSILQECMASSPAFKAFVEKRVTRGYSTFAVTKQAYQAPVKPPLGQPMVACNVVISTYDGVGDVRLLSLRAPDGRSSTFKRALAESGFAPGDRVVIIRQNDYERMLRLLEAAKGVTP